LTNLRQLPERTPQTLISISILNLVGRHRMPNNSRGGHAIQRRRAIKIDTDRRRIRIARLKVPPPIPLALFLRGPRPVLLHRDICMWTRRGLGRPSHNHPKDSQDRTSHGPGSAPGRRRPRPNDDEVAPAPRNAAPAMLARVLPNLMQKQKVTLVG
jgi:hypothetical protein